MVGADRFTIGISWYAGWHDLMGKTILSAIALPTIALPGSRAVDLCPNTAAPTPGCLTAQLGSIRWQRRLRFVQRPVEMPSQQESQGMLT